MVYISKYFNVSWPVLYTAKYCVLTIFQIFVCFQKYLTLQWKEITSGVKDKNKIKGLQLKKMWYNFVNFIKIPQYY